jgi:hypothetical protein
MRRNSTSTIGALHPVLFFLCVYGISLFLAIFVCRTVYFSMNHNEVAKTAAPAQEKTGVSFANATASIGGLK